MKQFRKYYFLYLAVSLILIFYSCHPVNEQKTSPIKWSSQDPLMFNIKARLQKYKKGNLVYNPSFESGKRYEFDSLKSSVNLDGWEILGDNVKWIDLTYDSLQSGENEVWHGKRAIKISRSKNIKGEVQQQGVFSDYIRVIPGNYQLSFRIRLQNIVNPKQTFGTKVYDAVDIRVKYYDRNLLEINPIQWNKELEQYVDYSFKGLSFANFQTIDSTGWLNIIGRSHFFPFPDGDIIDNARYVRIFIGLKGFGTIWVDSVNFKYTRYNLTTEERLLQYFDSVFTKYELLIPQPKKVDGLETIIYYRHEENDSPPPMILLSGGASASLLSAGNYFREEVNNKIRSILGDSFSAKDKVQIKTDLTETEIPENQIVFSIGKNGIARKFQAILPYQELKNISESYFIYSNPDLPNFIFIDGTDERAIYDAILTTLQLFDTKRLLFHNANIIDFPDFTLRSAYIKTSDSNVNIDELITGKLNYFYFDNNKSFKTINFSGSSYFGSGKVIDLNKPDICNSADEKQTSQSFLINSHNRNLYFQDYFIPDSLLPIKPTSKVSSLIDNCSNSNLLFYTLWSDLNIINYSSERAGIYFNSLNDILSNKFPLVFSGYGYRTWRMDDADFLRFNNISGSLPVFMDMSLFLRSSKSDYFAFDSLNPERLSTISLIDPYDNEIISDIKDYCSNDQILLHYVLENDADMIRWLTAADYYWNREAYNPDFSLFKVLYTIYGSEVSKVILKLDKILFTLKSELDLYFKERNSPKHLRKARNIISSYITIINEKKETNLSNIEKTYLNLINVQIKRYLTIEGVSDNSILDSININKY